MTHDLKILVERFEADTENEHHIESYRPGDYRYYSAWRHNAKISSGLRSNEMIAWLEGFLISQSFTKTFGSFKAFEDGYNAQTEVVIEEVETE